MEKKKMTTRRKWFYAICGITVLLIVGIGFSAYSAASGQKQISTKVEAAKSSAAVEAASSQSDDWLKDDFFKVAPLGENPYGNLIQPSLAGVGVDEETQTGSLKQIADRQLEATAKNPATLVGTTRALLPDREIPKELTVEINGEKYLSEEAQILWAELSTIIISNYQDKTMKTVDSIPAKGYTDGMDQNGNYIVSADERDFTGKNGVQWTNSKGQTVYSDADCANWVFATVPKGVKRGAIPPRNITPKPPITVSPKNIEEAPQNNPEVIRQDTDNVRPGAGGNENAGVDNSPGTAYQGESQADVVRRQQAEAEAAAAAERQRQQQQQQQQQQHQKAQDQAQKALSQEPAGTQKDDQSKAQEQTNKGSVSGGDGW